MRIAIAGLGRIGRAVLRRIATRPDRADVEVAAVTDIAEAEALAYPLRYDSVFGPASGGAEATEARLRLGDLRVPFHRTGDLRETDLSGVDVVMECSGTATAREVGRLGLEAGAARVLVSGPSGGVEATAVLGANEDAARRACAVSNASCTTDAVAPLLARFDAAWGLVPGHATTVHCYTGSQPMVDAPRGDPARGRAGAVSIVPTTTRAARLIDVVLPQLAGRITGAAVRVPVIGASSIDLVATVERPPRDAGAALMEMADGYVIGIVTDPCVSVDLRMRTESLVIAVPQAMATGDQVRTSGCHHNGWGFAACMIGMARPTAGEAG